MRGEGEEVSKTRPSNGELGKTSHRRPESRAMHLTADLNEGIVLAWWSNGAFVEDGAAQKEALDRRRNRAAENQRSFKPSDACSYVISRRMMVAVLVASREIIGRLMRGILHDLGTL